MFFDKRMTKTSDSQDKIEDTGESRKDGRTNREIDTEMSQEGENIKDTESKEFVTLVDQLIHVSPSN